MLTNEQESSKPALIYSIDI